MRASLASLSLALLLAACGKTTSLTDAPTGDGNGVDAASLIDADAHGPVTVTVYATDGTMTPVKDVPVVFVEPNGTIEATVPTDVNGVARANVLPGASVTAAYPTDANNHHQLETVLGVKPGDAIAIGPLGSPPHTNPTGNYNANVHDYPGSTQYTLYGPCDSVTQAAAGSGALTVMGLNIYDDCKQSTMDLLVVANDGSGDTASVEQNGVTYGSDGTTDMGSGWQPMQTVTATYTNVPISDVVSLGFYDRAPDYNGYGRSSYVATTTATTTTSVPVPGTAHALIETQLYPDTQGRQQVFETVDGTATTYDLDVSTQLLQWLGVPTLDAANGKITVTLTGTSTLTPDVYDTLVDYDRVIATVPHSFEWEVFTATPGDVTLPPLPSSLADDVPLATDNVSYTQGTIFDADAVTSYDQIRGELFHGFDAYQQGRGATGRLRISENNLNVGFTGHLRRARH